VDERALVAALDAGHIGGAAVDVYQQEPTAPGDPLLGHPRVITTPHTAAETEETYTRVGAATAAIGTLGSATNTSRAASRMRRSSCCVLSGSSSGWQE
jgi:phosphoglycerate dehydrogenase-like enzyme